MRAIWRLLGYMRSHLGWVAVAVAGMAGVALTSVLLVALLIPVFDEVLGPGASTTVLEHAQLGKSGAAAKTKVFENPTVRAVQTFIETAREGLRRHLPNDKAALIVLAFLVLVAKNVLNYFGHYAFYRAGLAAIKDLRDRLFDAILKQSAHFLQQQPTAVLMSRVTNDVEQIRAFISDTFGYLFQDGFTVIALLVYVLSLQLHLALVSLLVTPAILWPVVHFARKMRRRSHQSQERLGEMNTVLDEVLKGFRVVHAFGMELFEALRFRDATMQHFRANLKARKVQALSTPVVEVVGGAALLALTLYAATLIERQQMTLGVFTSFLFAFYSMYGPVKRLNQLNLAMQMAVASGERVFAVMDEPIAVTDRPGAQPLPGVTEAIVFDHVTFAYESDKPVLSDFCLTIPAGKAVALVGASGAGKSTVAQLLPRFWDVEQGSITIDGHDLRDLQLASLREKLGLVTQETVLFNATFRANIAYGQEHVDEDRMLACAQAAFADEFIREFPDGYDTVAGEAGLRLSGGQRQRIAVARALYKNPPILILDEATSALDAEAEGIVQRALENLMQGRTTLVIAHRLATVRNADIIVVMEEGRVVEQGTHAELLGGAGLYARLAQLQGITE
ncbi:MAG: ABC transporter ATP-binding protein [Thermoanaerobaculales bacterium]